MKVKMKIHTGRDGKLLCPGDVIKVDDLTGSRWIDKGFAEPVHEAPAPKKEQAQTGRSPAKKPEEPDK